MTQRTTLSYEDEARSELLSSIGIHIEISPGINNAFFDEEFGVEDTIELYTMPISRLQKIADTVENIFC